MNLSSLLPRPAAALPGAAVLIIVYCSLLFLLLFTVLIIVYCSLWFLLFFLLLFSSLSPRPAAALPGTPVLPRGGAAVAGAVALPAARGAAFSRHFLEEERCQAGLRY